MQNNLIDLNSSRVLGIGAWSKIQWNIKDSPSRPVPLVAARKSSMSPDLSGGAGGEHFVFCPPFLPLYDPQTMSQNSYQKRPAIFSPWNRDPAFSWPSYPLSWQKAIQARPGWFKNDFIWLERNFRVIPKKSFKSPPQSHFSDQEVS